MFTGIHDFYRSQEWRTFRRTFIQERLARDGEIIDEYTGKPIMNDYDIILHHKVPLTTENLFDYSVSLNPDNIMIVTHKSHNYIHEKFQSTYKKVFIVFGSPASGKTTWVNDVAGTDDLILDLDKLYEAINNYRSPKLYSNVMQLWNTMIDMVKTNNGRWSKAYVILANCRTVERLQNMLGGEVIHISTDKKTCYERAENKINKYGDGYKKYLDDYWYEYENVYGKILTEKYFL